MNEKQLLDNLKTLKTVSLPADWKLKNRDILFSQVSNSLPEEDSANLFFVFFSRLASHPVAVALFAFVLVGSGLSFGARRQFKPGDSFYVARLASEKAQLAVTFDKDKKEKMEIRFASERARDIASAMEKVPANQNKKEELEKNFQKEMAVVKEGVKKMGMKKNVKVENKTALSKSDATGKVENTTEPDADSVVFSAGSGKDNQGVKVNLGSTVEASSSTSTELVAEEVTGHTIAEEAEKLFMDKNYSAVGDKLQEVEALIDGKGLVKGEESAKIDSSTEATSSQHN